MTTNVTASIVKQETLNSNLARLDDTTVNKYIKRSLSLVFSYISTDAFKQEDGSYVFPDELVTAIVCIVEYIFIDNGMFWGGPNSYKSEKIGDYTYTKKDAKGTGGLDLPDNIVAILDKYVTRARPYGMSIGWYDREYTDL